MSKKKYYEDGVDYDWNTIKYTTYDFRKALRDLRRDDKLNVNEIKENHDERTKRKSR